MPGKALIISYYFPPMGLSGVQRTTKFVKYLPDFDWEPIVLTSAPSGFYAYDDGLNNEIEERGINVYRTGEAIHSPGTPGYKTLKFPSYTFQKIGRAMLQTIYQPDSKISWKKKALKMAEQIFSEHEIDIIFATAPPYTDFLIARELSEKYGVPFVIDYRDTWVDNPFHFYATPFHKRYSIKLEQQILTHAEKAIVITRYAKELLLQRYRFLSHSDVDIIPHGFDAEDFAPHHGVKPSPDKMVITHSGLFQDNRTPKHMLKALRKYLDTNGNIRDNIELRFVGIMRKGHKRLIRKYGLNDVVKTKGYLSHTEAVRNLLESDVLWLQLNDTIRTPGKLYEYFGAGRTILATVPDGMMATLARESGAALVTGHKDVPQINRAIGELYDMWKHGALPVPSGEFTEKYDRRNLTGQLAKILSMASDL